MSESNEPGIQEFLQQSGVTPVTEGEGLPAASIPVPEGWTDLGDGVVPGARQVLAAVDRASGGWSPNAVLFDSTVAGPLDVDGLLQSFITDARRLPGWQEDLARVDEGADGQRAIVRGAYEAEGLAVRVTTTLLVSTHGENHHLAQLTVTIKQDAHDMLDGVDAIIDGLTVTA
ncbi:LpqN/LpqT family lipoprotein [Tomitella biformata]|uniref:LpqN/LpqT family lipoprotein n=1 Tax=Tomitella biformata TaxID=630403 RepID=UPI000464DA94|nr:LpqN/LpqT family lipoprotein [Tomitella biformata]